MSRRQLAEAVSAGLGSAAIPSVSIKGNMFTLVDSSGEQKPIETPYMDCVIIDTQIPSQGESSLQRVFWGLDETGQPKQFDDSGNPPACFSDNGVGASINAQHPQSSSCAACQYKGFNWVSKMDPSKRTSACRPIKKIAVLPMQEINKVWEPVFEGAFLLRVPIMSHENLGVYTRKFKGQQFDVTEVVTRISFVRGQVGQLDFDGVARVDDEVNTLIDKLLDSHVTDALVGRGDVAVQGQITAQPPRQEAVPSAAPPPQPAPALFQAPAAEPTKRTAPVARKPRAAKVEAVPAQDDNIPPFLRRQPEQVAAQPATEKNTGIVSNAPPPPADMQATLDSIFKLPT